MEEIRKWLKDAVISLFMSEEFGESQLLDEMVEAENLVTVAPESSGADYATNVAMRMAKLLHKSPMAIAEELKEAFSKGGVDSFETSVAAPGFLNFYAKNEYFEAIVGQYATDLAGALTDNISWSEYRDKVVITEFSDPNPFKVLHVGHLYTSIVGDSISRLLEFAGAKVARVNFGGDVGLHVGKTLYAVLRAGHKPEDLTIEKLAECYVAGTRAYDEDEVAHEKIVGLNKEIYRIAALGRAESEALGGEEGKLARLYFRGRELSYQYFEDFYQRIGVKFDRYYPESTVADRGLKEVREHVGSVYEESDGAVVFRGEKVGLHTRVFINQGGIPTYEAKDVGLIFTKWDDYHFDTSVVITGNEIIDYMRVVLASVSEYAPELVERTEHLTHGMVKLVGSVKMSSRKGNFLKAVDVLEMIREELADGHEVDEKVVLAAVKYAFLKYKMGGDIVFDPKESVSVNGNSGVYLLYSTVRAKKILQKLANKSVKNSVEKLSKKVVQENQEDDGKIYERKLNKKIVQYGAIIGEAVREKAPYKLCTYLYELAQEFSRFYEHVQVVGSAREAELSVVVKAYAGVMEHGLGVLGVEVPEEM